MSGLHGFILLLHIIASALVVLIILIQPAKGEGLTGAFGAGGNTQALFGVRAGDVMTKATAFIAVFFVITSISLAFLQVKKSKSVMDKTPVTENAAAVPADPNAKSDVLNKYTDQVSGKIKNLFSSQEGKEAVTEAKDVSAEVAGEAEVTPEEAKDMVAPDSTEQAKSLDAAANEASAVMEEAAVVTDAVEEEKAA